MIRYWSYGRVLLVKIVLVQMVAVVVVVVIEPAIIGSSFATDHHIAIDNQALALQIPEYERRLFQNFS